MGGSAEAGSGTKDSGARRSDVLVLVVMGVAGSGKSTIAPLLASRFDAVFIDADWLHSSENTVKMSGGQPLSDADRVPWLRAVGHRLERESAHGRSTVTACSALKRVYRDILRNYVRDAFFVQLDGSFEVIHQRMASRRGGILDGSLLESQFAILEPLGDDEHGMSVDVQSSPESIVLRIVTELGSRRAAPE